MRYLSPVVGLLVLSLVVLLCSSVPCVAVDNYVYPAFDTATKQWGPPPPTTHCTLVHEWDGGATRDCVYTTSTAWVTDIYQCEPENGDWPGGQPPGYDNMEHHVWARVVGGSGTHDFEAYFKKTASSSYIWTINADVPSGGGWIEYTSVEYAGYLANPNGTYTKIRGKCNGSGATLEVDEVPMLFWDD